MVLHMVHVLVQLDEETAKELEAAVPARTRRRSEFIRLAIRRALWDLEEARTAEAYRRQPDDEPAYFGAGTWEPATAKTPRRRRAR